MSVLDRLADGMLPQRGRTPANAKQIKDLYDKASQAQRYEQLRMAVARSYLGGDQWISVNRAQGRIDTLPRDVERARLTDNRMASTTRTLFAKILKRQLVWEIVPSGSDDATVRGAWVAEAAATDLADHQRWEETLRRPALTTMWEGGTAVLWVDWDPRAGVDLGTDPLSGRRAGTGDVRCTVTSVAETFTEPGSTDLETGRWAIRAQALPPRDVQAYYQMDKPPKADSQALLGPSARGVVNGAENKNVDLTLVLTYYERPSDQNPKGRQATVVGDQVVADDDWPFPFKDRLNCVALRETLVTNRWTGDTILWQAPSLQNGINAFLSNTIEHLKYVGNARGIAPDGALDLIDELTDLPGEWFSYNSTGGKPEYLVPPAMPSWITQGADRLDARLDDLLGLHDISRGQSPGGVQSGVGLSILSENDDTPIGFMARQMAEAFSRLMTLCLKIYEANVTETRTARVRVGDVTETWKWTGQSFAGQTKAIVPFEAVVPKSHEAQRARALEMVKLGLIKSVADYELAADVSVRDRFADTMNPDLAKAKRENYLMSMGRPCLPADFDNHRTHIDQHNAFRKSARYEQMPDQERQMVDDHVQAHENLAAEDAAKKLMQTGISPALANAPEGNEGEPLPPMPVPGQPPPPPPIAPPGSAGPPALGGGQEMR